jgi:hypothetical protein
MRAAALCAALVFAGLAAALPVRCLAPAVVAGDDKEDEEKKRKEERRKREKEKREAAFKAIASEFEQKSETLLLNRVAKGSKLTLALGKDDGAYSAEQARGVLTKYFESMKTITVDLKEMKAEESVASFKVTVRRNGEEKGKTGKLYVTVGSAADKYPLVKLAVEL